MTDSNHLRKNAMPPGGAQKIFVNFRRFGVRCEPLAICPLLYD